MSFQFVLVLNIICDVSMCVHDVSICVHMAFRVHSVYLCRNYEHMQEVNMSLNKDSTLDMMNAYVLLYIDY